MIACGRSTGPFESSKSSKSGLTQVIKFTEGPAFGDPDYRDVKAIDTPGTGDFSISLDEIADQIQANCG